MLAFAKVVDKGGVAPKPVLPMEADRRLLGRVEVLSCGEKVKNKKGAHKPKHNALRVTTTGCETLDGRKDVNSYKKKSPKESGDVVGDERHRRALSLLCTAVGEGFGGLVEPGDNVTWRASAARTRCRSAAARGSGSATRSCSK